MYIYILHILPPSKNANQKAWFGHGREEMREASREGERERECVIRA
jgi:hypothetical protein